MKIGQWSPWGKVQHVETVQRGIYRVHTARHGGYMIAKGIAVRSIPKVEQVAIKYGGYFCFEEDCAAYIAEYFIPSCRSDLSDWSELALSSMRLYYPNYYKENIHG